MTPMKPEARAFFLTMAASACAAIVSGAAAATTVSLYPPGSGGAPPAVWGLVVLPVAVALVVAGALARTTAGVLLNSLAYLLPQLVAALAVFFLFAHPGGAGGPELVLGTVEFWVELGAAYAVVAILAGVASWSLKLARR